jgi:hypothetical protein
MEASFGKGRMRISLFVVKGILLAVKAYSAGLLRELLFVEKDLTATKTAETKRLGMAFNSSMSCVNGTLEPLRESSMNAGQQILR